MYALWCEWCEDSVDVFFAPSAWNDGSRDEDSQGLGRGTGFGVWSFFDDSIQGVDTLFRMNEWGEANVVAKDDEAKNEAIEYTEKDVRSCFVQGKLSDAKVGVVEGDDEFFSWKKEEQTHRSYEVFIGRIEIDVVVWATAEVAECFSNEFLGFKSDTGGESCFGKEVSG